MRVYGGFCRQRCEERAGSATDGRVSRIEPSSFGDKGACADDVSAMPDESEPDTEAVLVTRRRQH